MKTILFCFFLFLAVFIKAQLNRADKILGNWISPKSDLIVSCYKVGDTYFSKIVWFKRYHDNSPDDPDAIPENMWLNKTVMSSFSFVDDEWINGEIFNLKNGKKYSAYLKLNSDNELKVVGFLYFRIFNESIIFRRYCSSFLPDLN